MFYKRETSAAMWMGQTERMAKLMDESLKAKAARLRTRQCPPRPNGVAVVPSPGLAIAKGGAKRCVMPAVEGEGVRTGHDKFDQIGLVEIRDLRKSDVGNSRPRVRCSTIGCHFLDGPGTRW